MSAGEWEGEGEGEGGIPSWAQVTPRRREHIVRVAALVAKWAGDVKVPSSERDRWMRAAYLHDALKDAPADLLAPYTPAGWNSELAHGPAAAVFAGRHGEGDRGVLDAVKYHSVGYAEWDSAGHMLYLADYLDPGRTRNREHRAALAGRVPGDLKGALVEVAAARLTGFVRSGWALLPETVQFWNSLARHA